MVLWMFDRKIHKNPRGFFYVNIPKKISDLEAGKVYNITIRELPVSEKEVIGAIKQVVGSALKQVERVLPEIEQAANQEMKETSVVAVA